MKLCVIYREQSGLNKGTSIEDRNNCVMGNAVICTQITVSLM